MATKKELKKVYVLSGEPLLVREQLQELRQKAGVNEPDAFDLTELDGSFAGVQDVISAAATSPFLADRRTVILHRGNRLRADAAEALAKTLAGLPESSLLFITIEPAEDGKPTAAERHLINAAKKIGEHIQCGLTASNFVGEITKRAKTLGGTITPRAANELKNLTSDNLTLAVAELEKCILYSGGKVDIEDVRTAATPSREWQVFEMLDAIAAGNLGKALEHYKYLRSESKNIYEAAMASLFPALHRQLRMIWQAKACALENTTPANARFLPRQHNFSAAGPWVQSKTMRLADALSLSQISDMMRCLVEADMRLKGQLAAAFPSETVERMLFEMCRIAATRN